MCLFIIEMSLIVTFFITVHAAPIRSFRDVEKAWKEGRSEREIHAETADYHPRPSWRSLRQSNDPSEPPLKVGRTSLEITRSSETRTAIDDDDETKDRSLTRSLLDDWALHYLLPTSASTTSKASVAGHLNEHKKDVHHRLHHYHHHIRRHEDVDGRSIVEKKDGEFEYALDARTMAVRSAKRVAVEDGIVDKGKAGFVTVLRPVRGWSWNME